MFSTIRQTHHIELFIFSQIFSIVVVNNKAERGREILSNMFGYTIDLRCIHRLLACACRLAVVVFEYLSLANEIHRIFYVFIHLNSFRRKVCRDHRWSKWTMVRNKLDFNYYFLITTARILLQPGHHLGKVEIMEDFFSCKPPEVLDKKPPEFLLTM